MKRNTHISNVLEGNNSKDRYDAEVKKILSDKTVLSWILKYTVGEFDGYPVEYIRECIEGEPEVGTHRVYPGHTPEAITGLATEDKVPGMICWNRCLSVWERKRKPDGEINSTGCFLPCFRNGYSRKRRKRF